MKDSHHAPLLESRSKYEKPDSSSSDITDCSAPNVTPNANPTFSAWKDILVLASGAFCYNFGYVAFLFNLSTLYDDAKLVFSALAINCAAQLLTSLFLPALLIRRLGCKTTSVLAVSCVISFSAAQFYPHFATFIPSSIILGFGNTCLWVAVSTYVSNVGLDLAAAQNKRPDVVLSTLFGAVNFVRFSGAIVGNLVPYFVLSARTKTDSSNIIDLSKCGASYCSEPTKIWTPLANQSFHATFEEQMSRERMAVFGVYFIVGIFGPILLLLFLNPRRNLESGWDPSKINIVNLLMATIRTMKDPTHLLLMTTFLCAGLIRSFASGDFSKGFVLCIVGLNEVSLAATISNVCYVAGTTVVTLLVRVCGVAGALSITHLLCGLTLVGLLIWTPHAPMASTLLFIASALMGVVMGAYNNLNNTSIGLLFPKNKEESYGAYRFHYAMGSTIGYSWAVSVCMNVKIWILVVIVVIAEGTYLMLEYLIRKNVLPMVVK